MAHKVEIQTTVEDARATILKKKILTGGFSGLESVSVVDACTIDYDISPKDLEAVATMLTNPITEQYTVNTPTDISADFVIEIGFLPGVTDNVGHTAQESIENLLGKTIDTACVFSSQILFLKGTLRKTEVEAIAAQLANTAIQRIHIKEGNEYKRTGGMGIIIPRVKLTSEPTADTVNLDGDDETLTTIGKQGIPNKDGTTRGPLALDLASMKTIRDYFTKKQGRMPTDIELESIAQTWSEHCKHTIFASELDDIQNGIYNEYIKAATNTIRTEKGDRDFCVSVFKDNSGAIIFDEHYLITDKVETHNSPSALDPFGGAITGIVGVNRDTIGFGLGAMPILNRYGYCLGYPEDKRILFRGTNKTNPSLFPRRIMDGVIEGVKVGGNCSGIPTPQGFLYFDDDYRGKPLIFVGTVGLIPRTSNQRPAHTKQAQNGDAVVVIGGRVGKDGIHGATFSSEALDSGSPATAVQIGDPITQKKLSDAIIKEARDKELYNSITDNGAGGISCSVAEMAEECGGFEVDLEKVPVKYDGIQPWEIWISESQERMTLAVPKNNLDTFLALMKKRGVEATVIGRFNDGNKAVVRYNGTEILNIDMQFLHHGVPKKVLQSTYKKPRHEEPIFECPHNLNKTLQDMLKRHNICSYEFLSRQYDHEVQASTILKPLQGEGSVNAPATAIKPLYDSNKAAIVSQGITAKYGRIDMYHMAACAIDTAIRNTVAAGGTLNKTALLDNFCWCSSNEAQRLGELKAAAKACHDYAITYQTPFISGKDSMFNDFKGYDENNNPIKISVPPTLLISSISVADDYKQLVSIDAKFSGDHIYLLGETKNELGGSEYYELIGEQTRGTPYIGNTVPQVDAQTARTLYETYSKAVQNDLIASAIPLSAGGLGVALAKTCIAGNIGATIDLQKLKRTKDVTRNDHALFSETQSRILVTVAPQNKTAFEQLFEGQQYTLLGEITDKQLYVKGLSGKEIIHEPIQTLKEKYQERFAKY